MNRKGALIAVSCFALGIAVGAIAYSGFTRPYVTGSELSHNLHDIARTSDALRLLKTTPNEPLQRHLQLQLAFAAARAKVLIEDNPKMFPFFVADLRPFDNALGLLKTQRFDTAGLAELQRMQQGVPGIGDVSAVEANLAFVRSWVERQPRAAQSPSRGMASN
jgi:hypothetical protein